MPFCTYLGSHGLRYLHQAANSFAEDAAQYRETLMNGTWPAANIDVQLNIFGPGLPFELVVHDHVSLLTRALCYPGLGQDVQLTRRMVRLGCTEEELRAGQNLEEVYGQFRIKVEEAFPYLKRILTIDPEGEEAQALVRRFMWERSMWNSNEWEPGDWFLYLELNYPKVFARAANQLAIADIATYDAYVSGIDTALRTVQEVVSAAAAAIAAQEA